MSGCRKGDYEMTTANNIKGQNINNDLITALYCRLSVEDIKDDKNNKRRNIDESNSISNQELLCRGWFLPPNTYDCGSFVVNGTAVVGKEPKKAL